MSQPVILIADDDQRLRRLVRATLTGLPCRFVEAASGPGALTLARRDPPTVAILDVTMPEPDGINVCRQLKKDVRHPDPCVIMLTARAEAAVIARASEAGADAFVPKPFSPIQLRALVEEKLQAAAAVDRDTTRAPGSQPQYTI